MEHLRDVALSKIIDILRVKYYVAEPLLESEFWDEPLTGNTFRFSGIDLVSFFFDLEKSFHVRVPHTLLEGYGFSTINKIVNIICMQNGD